MKTIKLVIITCIIIAGGGAGFFLYPKFMNPTLVTSSSETIKQSIEKMRAVLPEAQQAKLAESMQVLALSNLNMQDIMAGRVNADSFLEDSLKKYEGQTAAQLISAAETIRLERLGEQKKQAIAEIAEIEERLRKTEESKKLLTSIEIVKSRFYFEETRYSFSRNPVIELTIKNNTDQAISRLYFHGIVASPNRTVPWISEDFNYQISGGLEPGETANWKLSPNSFSDWGRADVPSDAILTVTVRKADGADDKMLADVNADTQRDNDRLLELKHFIESTP